MRARAHPEQQHHHLSYVLGATIFKSTFMIILFGPYTISGMSAVVKGVRMRSSPFDK